MCRINSFGEDRCILSKHAWTPVAPKCLASLKKGQICCYSSATGIPLNVSIVHCCELRLLTVYKEKSPYMNGMIHSADIIPRRLVEYTGHSIVGMWYISEDEVLVAFPLGILLVNYCPINTPLTEWLHSSFTTARPTKWTKRVDFEPARMSLVSFHFCICNVI